MPMYLIEVSVACSVIQLGRGHDMELISKMCPQHWGSFEVACAGTQGCCFSSLFLGMTLKLEWVGITQ